MNCCLLRYSFDAAEWPSIRQAMSGANTPVIGAVPWCQASKAWRMISRLVSVRAEELDDGDLGHAYGNQPGDHALGCGAGRQSRDPIALWPSVTRYLVP